MRSLARVPIAAALACTFLCLTPRPATAAALTMPAVLAQIASDFALFETLETQFLVRFPASGLYFQGMTTPTEIPSDGQLFAFDATRKPSDRAETWADFGFAPPTVIAQYRITDFNGPNGLGYRLFAQFSYGGAIYVALGGLRDLPGLPTVNPPESIPVARVVPEPASGLLVGAALLGWWRQRRRQLRLQ